MREFRALHHKQWSTWRLVELFKSENNSRHQHWDGSTLGHNLITSHEVDYMSSALS